jgi:pyruvate dehydrogenase E1 component alpha subunit
VVDLYKRAAGYSMPGEKVDGNDILSVRKVTTKAVGRARAGEGPTFIENKTYRIKGHFEGDPQKYRTEEEVKSWQDEKDPLNRFSRVLFKKRYLSRKLENQILAEVQSKLNEAVTFAEDSPFPEPEDALTDLYIDS